MQPVQCISDMFWAEARLGSKRHWGNHTAARGAKNILSLYHFAKNQTHFGFFWPVFQVKNDPDLLALPSNTGMANSSYRACIASIVIYTSNTNRSGCALSFTPDFVRILMFSGLVAVIFEIMNAPKKTVPKLKAANQRFNLPSFLRVF